MMRPWRRKPEVVLMGTPGIYVSLKVYDGPPNDPHSQCLASAVNVQGGIGGLLIRFRPDGYDGPPLYAEVGLE